MFGVEPRADILHRVVTWQLEKRRGTARGARERSDVARTGKKFGRQKGGGTARHGDRRAPIFVGGGKAHGPRVRDFNPSLNKKVRALGLEDGALRQGPRRQADRDGKSRRQAKPRPSRSRSSSASSVSARPPWSSTATLSTSASLMASSNLREINLLPAVGANVYDILKHETLVLTRAAVERLEARFNG